jgi:hypothetical protein
MELVLLPGTTTHMLKKSILPSLIDKQNKIYTEDNVDISFFSLYNLQHSIIPSASSGDLRKGVSFNLGKDLSIMSPLCHPTGDFSEFLIEKDIR